MTAAPALTSNDALSRESAPDFARARRAMIDSQLRVSEVNDPAVLAAMDRVPREDFVPAAARGYAYIDRAIPLENGGALAAPLVHGRLLVEARIVPGERVLVVTGGSDYLPALVRALGAQCDSIDGDTAASRKGNAAYDLVLVDGALEHVPTALASQLAEGGRIVCGLATRGVTRLATGRKVAGSVALLPLAEIGMPVLGALRAPKGWSF
jgi:protein-L-isoaspartate(D-aspartate) O-methyltransferase